MPVANTSNGCREGDFDAVPCPKLREHVRYRTGIVNRPGNYFASAGVDMSESILLHHATTNPYWHIISGGFGLCRAVDL